MVFQCLGKFLNFDHKRVLGDADENFELDPTLGILHRSAQYTQNLKNLKGEPIELNGKMTLVSMKGGIWLGAAGKGQAIAKVCSPVTYKDFLPDDFDRIDYIVEIPPGVYSALVIAMVLAYEKMEQSYHSVTDSVSIHGLL